MADSAGEIPELGRLLALAERKLGPQHPKTIGAREKLAYAYDRAERSEVALPLLERVVQDMDRVIGPLHKRAVMVRKNLARLYYRCPRIAEALPLYHYTAG